MSCFAQRPHFALTPYHSTELLLEKGYEVHGIIRRSSSFNTNRLQHLYADQHEREHFLFLTLQSALSTFDKVPTS